MTTEFSMIPMERSQELGRAWQGTMVGVLGDVMLDKYLWGTVTRVSPEAPVPVVEVQRESFRIGGAGNVAKNIAALGGSPVLLGVVGEDSTGELLIQRLEEEAIGTQGVFRDASRSTSLKTRVVAQSQHLLRIDEESQDELEGEVEAQFLDLILPVIRETRALVISDYGKGVITKSSLQAVLREARNYKIPVCVDPKDTHFFSYQGVSVVTPNQHEAAAVLGFKLKTEELVERAGKSLLKKLSAESVLITRGEHGMRLFMADGSAQDFPAEAQRVYDVTGAGDTVIAVFALALAAGSTHAEAAFLANRAAGQVVAELGTSVPNLEALAGVK